MAARNIRELLDARPFRPFSIFLTDGSSQDIPHPEFGRVIGGRICVSQAAGTGIESGTGHDIGASFVVCRFDHVTHIGLLNQPAGEVR